MQQDHPQIQEQPLGEKKENIQHPHTEEIPPQEIENHEAAQQYAQEENHSQQPLEGQEPQQQGEPQQPPGPFDDQDEELDQEPQEQVQPDQEEEEETGDHQLEEDQPAEYQGDEQAEEGRSSNGPPQYNPDLIDDQDEEAATHPIIQDTQQLAEQGEFYMGEELIEPEGPSEVSHVYALQEVIEEWRDQEEPISSPHDYHFQGIHEEEAIEHEPALLSTSAQVGSSLMKLEPLPAQAVQTVEEQAKPETVEQSASTDPPPKTVPAATQAYKVETHTKTDIAPKVIKPDAIKPETNKTPKTSQVKSGLKSTIPKESKPHPEQKPKETVKQSKVASVQVPKSVQAVKKPKDIKQSQTEVIKTVPKTSSEQPSPKKQAEKTIYNKKTLQDKEQIKEETTPKKDNPPNLLLLRNQKEAQREQQAEQQKIEQEEARKNEIKEQQRLAKIEKEREEQQRQRKEIEKAENERRQKQRELMEQRQKQRERVQKERKDKQERQRLTKQQQQRLRQKEQQRQKQQQNLDAQNTSQVSKASMDREEPQQPASSLPPPTIAKKKKKKKVSKQPQNKSFALPDAPQSPPTAPASNKPPNHDKESERDVSVIHSDIGQEEPLPVRNMVNEILMAEGGKPNKEGVLPVVLTSLMVVRQAEKQRVGTTFRMFLKYNYQYERTLTAYKRIVVNVASQLQRKKTEKRPLQRILEDYFQDFAKIAKEFNDHCYKIQIQTAGEVPSKNPLASLRLQLKKGFEEMVFLRKSVANHNNRLAIYINKTLLPQLRKAFEGYYAGIVAEETKQTARRDELVRKEKQLAKVIAQAQRSFQKGLQGRFKEDLFIELSKFINEEKIHRATLRNYGRGLLDLRQTSIRSEKELFDRLQEQLLRFKQEWWAVYGQRRLWREAQGLGEIMKEAARFADLCTLVDLDYIKYVLELQSKQERERFESRDFENYLDLVFFDRVVGNIRDLLKGATNKSFPLRAQGDELIHSISGNLVVFNRPLDLCRDHFRISNLNAKVVATGTVEFDELQKGILFDDSRSVRLQLRDDDRAEQLICYLNEKEEDIVLPS